MFEFPLYVICTLFKEGMAKLSQAVKWLIPIVLIAAAAFAVFTVVEKVKNGFSDEATKMAESKAVIVDQEKQIKDQQRIIDEMKQTIEEMKASHEATLEIIKELRADQEKVEIKVTKKKQSIEKSLARIERLNIPEVDKEKQKSQVLIKGLNDTYCELFTNSCDAQGNAK